MTRSSNEIKDLITELEQPFDALRTRAKERTAQLYTEASYKADLIKALAPEIDTKIAMPSRRVNTAAFETSGILRKTPSFHVEPGSNLDRDERKADKLELFYAHLWVMQLDPGGRLRAATHRDQSVSPFCPWWLEHDAFALPKEEEKREKYRHDYAPFRLSRIDPLSVSFLTDDNGAPTVAARHFEMPLLRLVEKYGKDKGDKSPLTILNEQFSFIRGGRGQNVDESNIARAKASVWVLDDGVTQCHCIDVGDGKYEPLDDEFDNPWGRVPLFIVTGRYNAEANELVNRYEPLLADLFVGQRNVDVLNSHVASIGLTPSHWAQTLSDQGQMALGEGQSLPPMDFGDDGVATSRASDIVEIRTPLPPEIKEMLAGAIVERDAMLPPPYLTRPDEAIIKAGTLGAQLSAYETASKGYDDPKESEIAAIGDVFKAIQHFICSPKGHLKGEEKIYVTLNGKEPSRKYAKERKGEELEVSAADFDIEPVFEIDFEAGTPSQKALEYELVKEGVVDGVRVKEELIETFTEDVTGQKKKLNEEALFQHWAAAWTKFTFVGALRTVELKYGRDYSFMAMESGVMAPPMPGAVDDSGQAASPTMGSNGIGVNTTAPPPVSGGDAAVTT